MKKIVLLSLSVFAAFSLSAQQPRDWAQYGRYERQNAALAGEPVEVVFMGNSITDNWIGADPDFFARNGFVDRSEIIQHILRPDAQSHDRARIARAFVDRFGQEQQVGDQPGLVHAVGDADVVAGSRQGAVFRGPEHRVVCVRPAPRRTARKDVKVGERILAPVHGTPGDGHTLGAEVNGPRAGRGFGGKKGQRRNAEHDRKSSFHKHDKLNISVAANRMLKGTKNPPLKQTGRNLRGPAQGTCHGTA